MHEESFSACLLRVASERREILATHGKRFELVGIDETSRTQTSLAPGPGLPVIAPTLLHPQAVTIFEAHPPVSSRRHATRSTGSSTRRRSRPRNQHAPGRSHSRLTLVAAWLAHITSVKEIETMSELPYLDRVKVQCEILLPFYKRVRSELGAERAAALLREAVREYGLATGATLAQAIPGESVAQVKAMMPLFTAGDALDVEPVADTEAEFSINVRGCRYADYFKGLNEPEFGAMITCEMDVPMMETFSSTVTMERTQTIGMGGTHCDFRWKARS